MRLISKFIEGEQGQDLIEYALLAGFISISAIFFIGTIGGTVNSWYVGYNTTISSIPSGSGS